MKCIFSLAVGLLIAVLPLQETTSGEPESDFDLVLAKHYQSEMLLEGVSLRQGELIFRDIRSIRDGEQLLLHYTRHDPDKPCFLVQIIPSIPRPKEASVPSNSNPVTLVHGSCKAIASRGKALINASFGYQWDAPIIFHGRRQEVSWENRDGFDPFEYSPLTKSGIYAVCLLDESKSGREKFRDLFVVPPSWENQLRAAWGYEDEHHDIFNLAAAPDNRKGLLALVKNENPIIAAKALQVLAESEIIDDEIIRWSTTQGQGYLQSLFILVLLRFGHCSPDPARGASIARKVTKWVWEIEDIEKLRWIALGASAALKDRKIADEDAENILKIIEKKLRETNKHSGAFDETTGILKLSGLLGESRGKGRANRESEQTPEWVGPRK